MAGQTMSSANQPSRGPLLVIVGETASGKSAAALQLAEKYDGEIICADSRTVYRGMDIGTAKPTAAEQATVRHHLLDIVEPNQPFTAADFKRRAESAMADITARGKLPVMVGGTGMYIDAVLYDYQFRPPADPGLRVELNRLDVQELQQKLADMSIPLPQNERNPRHLIRAIESGGQAAAKSELRAGTLLYGIAPARDDLTRRITGRIEGMLARGLEREVIQLFNRYGPEAPGLQTIGYQEWLPYLAGSQDLERTIDRITKNTIDYAKRQRTWFRRNNSIQWFSTGEELRISVETDTTVLNR